jgi:predicted dehydrogenase
MTGIESQIDALIVGFGHVAENSYVPALQAMGMRVVGVVEPGPRAARATALLAATTSSSIPPADCRTGRMPLALNLTPAPLHADITDRLLDSRWNVLTEKPAAQTAARWRDLVAHADDSRLALVSAPFVHRSAAVVEVAARLADRMEPIRVSFDLVREGPAGKGVIDADRSWFFDPGQGPLRDLGVYGVNVLVALFGPPDAVDARRNHRLVALTLRSNTDVNAAFDVPNYQVRFSWPGADANLSIGFEPTTRDPYNARVDVGSELLTFSLWDYSLPVLYDGQPIRGEVELEARKYVHGLVETCRLIQDQTARSAHQEHVGQVLTAIEAIERGVEAVEASS